MNEDIFRRGLKDLVKEIIEDETDLKTRLDDLEEDIRELQGGTSSEDEEDEDDDLSDDEESEDQEPEPSLPEEERLEDNPERQVHEKKLDQAREKPTGTRVTKEDMAKLQIAPRRKIRPPVDPDRKNMEELEDERWDEEP